MKNTKIKIRLTRESEVRLIRRQARQDVGLPPVGKMVLAKKGGAYKRKPKHRKFFDD